MKNRGFTLVELITTFALTSVIIILFLNIINIMQKTYSNVGIKTELYINQSNLSNALNSKINGVNLDTYESCISDFSDALLCYDFKFIDGESIRLIVKEKEIKFGNYIYNLTNKTKVVSPTLINQNNFLVLRIPIKNDIYPDIDFGINLVYR